MQALLGRLGLSLRTANDAKPLPPVAATATPPTPAEAAAPAAGAASAHHGLHGVVSSTIERVMHDAAEFSATPAAAVAHELRKEDRLAAAKHTTL